VDPRRGVHRVLGERLIERLVLGVVDLFTLARPDGLLRVDAYPVPLGDGLGRRLVVVLVLVLVLILVVALLLIVVRFVLLIVVRLDLDRLGVRLVE